MMAADLAQLGLGLQPDTARTIGGGDTAQAARMLSSRGPVLVKELATPLPGMFAAEAAGLEWLGEAGLDVPEVLALTQDFLVLSWIDTIAPTAEAAAAFGAELAVLHRHEVPAFGVPPRARAGWRPESGWVGSVPIEYGTWGRWDQFYAEARLLPMAQLARERGRLPDGAHVAVARLSSLLQEGRIPSGSGDPPCRIHGDLWSGNLLWGGHCATVIDPAAHGGHPETDLAMLSLFGAPYLEDLLAGYERVRPLDPGWETRIPLHQVFPLLVHAAMFGGGYGHQAEAAARSAIRAGIG